MYNITHNHFHRLPVDFHPNDADACRRMVATHAFHRPLGNLRAAVANCIKLTNIPLPPDPAIDPWRLVCANEWADLLDEAVAEASALLPEGYSMVIEGRSAGWITLWRSRKECAPGTDFPTTRLLSPVCPQDAISLSDAEVIACAQAVVAFDAACGALLDWFWRTLRDARAIRAPATQCALAVA